MPVSMNRVAIVDRRDIERRQEARASQFEGRRDFSPGVLIEVDGSVEVATRPGYVWCREFSQQQSAFQVLNRRVLPVAGVKVKLGYPEKPPFERQVMGEWDGYGGLIDFDLEQSLEIPSHAQLHQYPSEANPGPDKVHIYQPALQMLKTTVYGSGMVIVTQPLIYSHEGERKYFAGGYNDLTSFVPATPGDSVYVLVYLNPVTNTTGLVAGTEAVSPTPPIAPSPSRPSALVLLTQGQTSLSLLNDVFDARTFLSDPAVGPHGSSHEYESEASPGNDVVRVFQPAIQPLKATADGTDMEIDVAPLAYWHEGTRYEFAGGLLDLSVYVPATPGDSVYVLVYLDPSTNSLAAVAGAEAPAPTEPTRPIPSIPSAMVLLTEGQTTIATSPDLDDARMFLHEVASAGGYPFTIHTVDLTDIDADFDNIPDALAAAVSGDVVQVGPGTFIGDIVVPAGVKLVGSGMDVTIIHGVITAVELNDGCLLKDLSALADDATDALNGVLVTGDDCMVENVRGEALDAAANDLVGIHVLGTGCHLLHCYGRASGGSFNNGLRVDQATATPPLIVEGGEYDGGGDSAAIDWASVDYSQVKLIWPTFTNTHVFLDLSEGHSFYADTAGQRRIVHHSTHTRLYAGRRVFQEEEGDGYTTEHYIAQTSATHNSTAYRRLFIPGYTSSGDIEIQPGDTMGLDVLLTGQNSGGTKSFVFKLVGAARNVAGTTTLLVSTVTVVYSDDVSFTPRININDPSDYVRVEVADLDAAGDVIHWVADIRATRINFP